jgi:seryl-tRNA synthetase
MMIDIKFLRENPDAVRASQKGRGENVDLVDQIIAIDEIKRAAIAEFEALRQEQNTLSKSVGAAKGDEKTALLANAKELADKVKAADSKRAEVEEQTKQLVLQLSNLLDTDAPIGGEEDLQKMDSSRRITSNSANFWVQSIPSAVQRLQVHVLIT